MIAAALFALQVGFASGVVPDTVLVGDPFRVVVRVAAPGAARVQFPASLGSPGSVDALSRAPQVVKDASGNFSAVYRLVAWQPGVLPAPDAPIRVVLADGNTQVYNLRPRLPYVRSVLPADTAGLRPRPARGVWGHDRDFPWPWIWGSLAVVLASALFWFVLRRRRTGTAGGDPRQEALAALDRLQPAATDEFYAALASLLREFLVATSPRYGLDLTTTELLERMAATGTHREDLAPLRDLLGSSDWAKFARGVPDASQAAHALGAAREWVASFEQPEDVA